MTYEEAIVGSAVSIIVKHWEQGFRTVYGEMCDSRYNVKCVLYEVAKHRGLMEMLSEKLSYHECGCVAAGVSCLSYKRDDNCGVYFILKRNKKK